MKNGLILVTEKLTAKDIPLLTQYNPFVVSKEPVTDQEVIRAMKRKKVMGVSGVDSISDLQVTIGNDPVRINGLVPIGQIISALNGKCAINAIQEDSVGNTIDESTDDQTSSLYQKMNDVCQAIYDLAGEIRKARTQVIITKDSSPSQHICNSDVFKAMETGYYTNVG